MEFVFDFRNWVLVTNSDFLKPIFLKSDVADLYFLNHEFYKIRSACKDIETWILEIVARAHGAFISEVSL